MDMDNLNSISQKAKDLLTTDYKSCFEYLDQIIKSVLN